MTREEKIEVIARRTAMELHNGDVVNLGIGIPTYASNYLPEGVHVILHAELGNVGAGPAPEPGCEDYYIADASGHPSSAAPGNSFVNSATSFALIRGGHVDATVLGALQVDEKGNIANWIVPGKVMPGMGGAMDLVVGAKRVIAAMEHTAKGAVKLMKKCTLPLTATSCVDRVITEMAVIDITDEGMVLAEYNPAFTIEEIQAATEAELIITENTRPMITEV